MRELSAFDIIGPVMVGPSSSHTAGALKIARIARRLAGGKITGVHFKLFGSFAKTYKGHGTDRALVGGILGMETDDLNIRNSFEIARGQGINFIFDTENGENPYHPNTVEITVIFEGGELTLRGSSVGGGEIEITNINGTDISFSGQYDAFIIHQKDAPGVIARVAGLFEKYNVNIAFMRVYRDGRDAYSIVEIDGSASDGLMNGLRGLPDIVSVSYFDFVD